TSQSDSDEVSDKDEYTMGTNPTNGNSYLHIVNLRPSGVASNMNVTWTTDPRRQYYLEIASTISNETVWTDSGLGLMVPTGNPMTRPGNYGSATQQFWRVQPVVPLTP
ncbi:MAG: hypothetical protein JRJ48_05375, partial [Deltaproteobacteria bacterium]|nr:hypothetical protein [Deltaproteobacteria bacterium]